MLAFAARPQSSINTTLALDHWRAWAFTRRQACLDFTDVGRKQKNEARGVGVGQEQVFSGSAMSQISISIAKPSMRYWSKPTQMPDRTGEK